MAVRAGRRHYSFTQMLRPLVAGIEALTRAQNSHAKVLERIEKAGETSASVPALVGDTKMLLVETKTAMEQRNVVNRAMFEALHSELKAYRDEFMLDAVLRPIVRDLINLYDDTLVICAGEFGRTPRITHIAPEIYKYPGRDHWAPLQSVPFAGGGVRGGTVIGSSDAWAAEPRDRPIAPPQIAATVFAALGLDPSRCVPGPDGRPRPLADAEPIHELLS